MKHVIILLSFAVMLLASCHWIRYKRVSGNGNLETQNREIDIARRIKLAGSFDVEISQGPVTSVKVEADENLLPYIFTDENNGVLLIRTRDHVNLVSDNPIKVYITTDKLEEVQLAGSGNIIGQTKFTGGNRLLLKIAGSGDIRLDVNTPSLESEIAGSGSMTLTGETKDQRVQISGVGDYKAADLKSENSVVRIAGSGDVSVFAASTLDIHIAGVGSVFYKGDPAIKQSISGSGEVKKLE